MTFYLITIEGYAPGSTERLRHAQHNHAVAQVCTELWRAARLVRAILSDLFQDNLRTTHSCFKEFTSFSQVYLIVQVHWKCLLNFLLHK